MLYAYYTFSYVSKLPEAEGRRVGFEGCSMMTLRDGKIADYREVANVGPAFVELGFAPERTANENVYEAVVKHAAKLCKDKKAKLAWLSFLFRREQPTCTQAFTNRWRSAVKIGPQCGRIH